jgi:hypothetical protein
MEREEDGQPRWGAMEMPTDGGALSRHYGREPSREDK